MGLIKPDFEEPKQETIIPVHQVDENLTIVNYRPEDQNVVAVDPGIESGAITVFRLVDPNAIAGMSKEEKLKEYFNALSVQEEAEAICKEIKELIMAEMEQDQEKIANYYCSRISRTTISTKPEDAEKYGAVVTVMKKEVDKDMIKRLIEKGIKVPGVNTTTYLKIEEVKED